MFEEILSELKEEYRQVFVLRHVQDMTVADVAKILGWSKGKVRTTDFRAMAKVRNVLISGKEVQGLSEFKTQN
ncbi:MAG: hypothetical protein A2201_12110 [Alicyclobacillus sp. RIFOXYA1_FULL_53_8]|nr:MAG: hypothetical protein A2201_12110 [Alicyclobacillus sp. RIFOXYA1_FULL_53_8]